MAETSSVLAVDLRFVNRITQNRNYLIRNPLLPQGTWTESPDQWDPSNVVPWQEMRSLGAEGNRPTGVIGEAILEIPASGMQAPTHRITFRNDANGASFLIDGSTFKTIVQGNDVFFANIESSLEGSVLQGILTVTGDNVRAIHQRLADATAFDEV